MELKAFIRTSLPEIMGGIREAQQEWHETTGGAGAINPAWGGAGEKHNRDLEFDVAVTVEQGKTDKMNAGIKVVGLSLGGQMQDVSRQSTVSRIKFSIPIAAPVIAIDADKFGLNPAD